MRVSIFTTRGGIASFQRKIKFWKRCVEKGLGKDFLIGEYILIGTIQGSIVQHFNVLQQAFHNTSHLPLTVPGSEIHIVIQRVRTVCLSKITSA